VSVPRIGVFLDRDGTLNEELDYIRTPDDLHLIHGAAAAVRKLNDRGLTICIISNQSGVARGILKERDLVPIHQLLEQELQREGARVNRIYYCPHHPTDGIAPYNIVCECRKPNAGMLQWGEDDFNLDLSHSFVVGDSIVDMQAGNSVGATTVLVLTGHGKTAVSQCERDGVHVDHIAPTIVEAVDYIVKNLDAQKNHD
jgi:D-glycero-D-manno-heptose 1,7-bisphosphate phosphatase